MNNEEINEYLGNLELTEFYGGYKEFYEESYSILTEGLLTTGEIDDTRKMLASRIMTEVVGGLVSMSYVRGFQLGYQKALEDENSDNR